MSPLDKLQAKGASTLKASRSSYRSGTTASSHPISRLDLAIPNEPKTIFGHLTFSSAQMLNSLLAAARKILPNEPNLDGNLKKKSYISSARRTQFDPSTPTSRPSGACISHVRSNPALRPARLRRRFSQHSRGYVA